MSWGFSHNGCESAGHAVPESVAEQLKTACESLMNCFPSKNSDS